MAPTLDSQHSHICQLCCNQVVDRRHQHQFDQIHHCIQSPIFRHGIFPDDQLNSQDQWWMQMILKRVLLHHLRGRWMCKLILSIYSYGHHHVLVTKACTEPYGKLCIVGLFRRLTSSTRQCKIFAVCAFGDSKTIPVTIIPSINRMIHAMKVLNPHWRRICTLVKSAWLCMDNEQL